MNYYSYLLNAIPKRRPLHLLDIGCSNCTEGEELIQSGIRLTGIDQDEETICAVRKRLPEGHFYAMNALDFRPQERYDVILLRRPDLILSYRTWKTVFALLPSWIMENGMVIVTAPGAAEAKIAQDLLEETNELEIEVIETGWEDENYMLSKKYDAPTSRTKPIRNPLISELIWNDEQPAWVCDRKTGICKQIPEMKED